MSDESRDGFAEIDTGLLRLTSLLNSARVATWCWMRGHFPRCAGMASTTSEFARQLDAPVGEVELDGLRRGGREPGEATEYYVAAANCFAEGLSTDK